MVSYNRVSVISLTFIVIGIIMAYVGVMGSSDAHIALVIVGSIMLFSGTLGASFVVALPIRRLGRRYVGLIYARVQKRRNE